MHRNQGHKSRNLKLFRRRAEQPEDSKTATEQAAASGSDSVTKPATEEVASSAPDSDGPSDEEIAILKDLRWLIKEGYVIEYSTGAMRLATHSPT